ncbi:DEAD/DEAH box helicase [Pacificimonas sp. WHA3]|uniref:DEAD/DEAH box helicase n=1 Tax=Pacificimonas pallii TaxID=2827236 RepID=A0ABS6SIL3_9SPHN|nr:DEAD/DEAH box helicase [Pacificimonas pallii]MBV7257761.1 DEAD/DEAH box helicase [Pacificimonas pallii]
MTSFKNMNLAQPLLRALESEGYDTPTPIQAQTIPICLDGHDVLGIAQTGTGKTAAFALPILDRFSRNTTKIAPRRPRALVLAPTRELATQIAVSFRTYGRFLRLSVETAFGGTPVGKQKRALDRGVDILVATPGRLIDLLEQRALTLDGIEVLVLDEADQMLDMGFIHALRRIVPLVPKSRQTLFFSATMPKDIAELAGKYLTNPKKVAVTPVATTAERIEQRAVLVNGKEKQALLTVTLERENIERALVFTRTKHGADRVVRHLLAANVKAAAIHGNKSQAQRERALEAFREGKCRVLVATDIAARGIDVDGISHVINFEIPNVPEQYVHRIGRTARAGAEGLAISFVAKDERPYLRDIERLTRQKVEMVPLPDNFMADVDRIGALKLPPKKSGGEYEGGRGGRSRGPRNGGGGDRNGNRNGGNRRGKPVGEAVPETRGKPHRKGKPGGRPQGETQGQHHGKPRGAKQGPRRSGPSGAGRQGQTAKSR